MQVITSKENEMIKNIKKLKEKKYRDQENKFIVEGIKMVQEAILEQASIDKIVICEDCINDGTIEQELLYEIAKKDCIYVSEKVFESITDVTNPQGILAIINKQNAEEQINYNEDIIVVLDGIQDPGNLGTILRTIDSVGLTQVILSENTADSYNPKVVRSTMGAIYRVKILKTNNIIETLKNVQKNKYKVISTSLQTDKSIYDIEYKKLAIVIGNEANGVSEEVLKLSDAKIKIPMLGKTESLNAAVATGVILYEYVRNKIN
ncbi:MAG: RNA methyltransferase [Clostridiaceae bacterium]|nr:RNA methyltransferase [Clostridiaceae bacterium]